MIKKTSCLLLAGFVLSSLPAIVGARDNEDEAEKLRKKLEALATIEQKVMVPMRDGVRLATDVYRPKGGGTDLPAVFWRTPYSFNSPDSRSLELIAAFVGSGYALIMQNERGKFFSEGEWEILGRPRTDGHDALTWIADQPWSNGKVGTMGCSSSAEWQLALAATDHPAHAAMVPMAAGAGIGRVGDFHEQGNWYRGGVFQMLFLSWLHGVQNTQRPRLPGDLSREDLVRLSKYFDLAPDMPEIDWDTAIRHLPLAETMESVDGPKGIFAELIRRSPDDEGWYEGGLYHDDEPWGVPTLWFNSWYDISVGPNLALFNHITRNADDPEVARNQFVVIAPLTHCGFFGTEEETVVGERALGDARLDYVSLITRWFDYWLKGEDNGFPDDTPKVQYYTMGSNQWQSGPTWPPADVQVVTYYLGSGGQANSIFGDGTLSTDAPGPEKAADTFTYDPALPVPSVGGGVCCMGDAIEAGSFDQREVETRNDVLVYTSAALDEDLEVTGTIEVTLYVSSDARDTDFTVKLVDVHPDGRAYNIDETIQRVRYREGYDKQVLMESGEVYELAVSPMSTSASFGKGHRIRIEVSSSNFPRFARNLNTGGNNYDESEGVVARNAVHHSAAHPSQIRLPVARGE